MQFHTCCQRSHTPLRTEFHVQLLTFCVSTAAINTNKKTYRKQNERMFIMAVINVNYFSHALMRYTDITVVLPIEPSAFPPPPGVEPPDLDAPIKTIYLLHGFSAITTTGFKACCLRRRSSKALYGMRNRGFLTCAKPQS